MVYIKRIKKDDDWFITYSYKWQVVSRKYGTQLTYTFKDAIKYMLWYLGVPAKILFKK